MSSKANEILATLVQLGLVASDKNGGVAASAFGASNKLLTVGAGGRFKKIQDALDYVATQPGFLPLDIESMQARTLDTYNGHVLSWAQGSDQLTLDDAPVGYDTFNITVMPTTRQTWIKLAGDTYHYPFEYYSNAANGVADILMHLTVAMRRIESNVMVGEAGNIHWYTENNFTILLLDAFIKENVTFAQNCCVTFTSLCNTVWHGTITKGANFVSGKLRFENVRMGGDHGTITSGWPVNTIAMEFFRGEIDQTFEDFIYPGTNLGSFLSQFTVWNHQPTNQNGNAINPTCVGDIVIQDIIWNVISHATITGNGNNAYLVDRLTARNVIVDGVHAHVKDRFGTFDEVAILGNDIRAGINKVAINDTSLICHDTSTLKLTTAVVCSTMSANMEIHLDNNSIHAPNCSGAQKLVRVLAAPAGGVAVKIGRGNSVTKCDAAANLTYTKNAGVAGTATVAGGTTAIVVTHGLGYQPNAADINIVPTGLGSAKGYYVTAVGATTFTINTDQNPVTSATFAWAIRE